MDPTSNFTLSQRTHARLHTRDLRTFSLSLWACSLEQQRPMHWRTASASNSLSLRLQCLLLRLAPRFLRTALAANRPLLLPALSALEPHRPSLILHTAASRQQPAAISSSSQRYRFLPLPNPGQARLCHLLLSHPIILTRRPLSPSHLTRLILQRQGSVPADRSIRGRRHPNETTSARLHPIHRCRQHRFLSLVPLHLPGASTSSDSPIDIRLRASCFYVERLQRSNSLVYRLHRLIQLSRPASVFGSHVL